MRVLISGGGTGGHVYPALAVAEQLRRIEAPAVAALAGAVGPPPPGARQHDAVDTVVLWVGGVSGMEETLVRRAGIDYVGIKTGQVTGVKPATAAMNLGRMVMGVRATLGVLARFQPTVCLVTGGYVCVPVVMACRMRGVPVMIYLPDMAPGSAIRLLSRLADRVAVSFADVAPYFGGEAPMGKAVVTGYPVRRELVEAASDRIAARRQLAAFLERPNLEDDPLPLVLIWGGSQGARSINRATWDALPEIADYAHIVHIVGVRDWPLYNEHAAGHPGVAQLARYHPVDYLHESMPVALAAADLTVARAGASILGEFPVAGLPAVLVPLPHVGVNQQANAQLLADRGAAVVVDDDVLDGSLTATLVDLLTHPTQLAEMAAAARRLAMPDAARHIAGALDRLQKDRP